MSHATVLIWTHAGVAGHSALRLPDGTYITWLDGEDQELIAGGRWLSTNDAARFGHHSVWIRIPVRFGDVHCGLDAEAIRAWWERHRATLHSYRAISKTRSSHGVVVQALCAGRAELYTKSPVNIVYQGTATLETWARALAARIQERQQLFAKAMGDLLNGLPYWMPNVVGAHSADVMTLDAWKRASTAGAMAVRREQVAAIDALLPAYHANPQVQERLFALYDILALTVEHLEKKPQSPRRPGVLALGRQVYDKIQELEQMRLGLVGVAGAAF